jgi:hypothetical protein
MTKNILIRDLKLSSDVQNALYDMGILIDESIDRFKKLKSLGYSIKYIWESDWKNFKKGIEMRFKRVSNLINPTLELFSFNYKNNVFLYRCDERYGYSFFKYE